MTANAITIEHLSKIYQKGKPRRGEIRSTLSSWWSGLGHTSESFYALQDINLTIQQGDIIGIVGPNGAGKSTLLKLLSRITFPSEGRITIRGKLSSMLEVGTGFHPELTGRENIYLNGAIIGMHREEVNRKLDSIVTFSELEAFLDTPVKHYSSGMYVRLAFSVASHLEPDILLIDEVLAVGDQEFRKKCMSRLLDVSRQGRTILMVSHQMSYLRELCVNGIYLYGGKLLFQGQIDEAIDHYVTQHATSQRSNIMERTDRRGSGVVRLMDLEMVDEKMLPVHTISAGQPVLFRLHLKANLPDVFNVVVQMEFVDLYGQLWFVANNSYSQTSIASLSGSKTIECHIPKFPLNPHSYAIHVGIYVMNQLADEVLNAVSLEVQPGMYYSTGKLPPIGKGMLVDYEWKQ